MQSDAVDNSIAQGMYLDVMKFQSCPLPSNDQDNQGLVRFAQEIEWVTDVTASIIIEGRAPVAHAQNNAGIFEKKLYICSMPSDLADDQE